MCVNTVNRQMWWGWWTARQMHTQPNHQQNPTSKSAQNIQNTRRANCAFCSEMRKTCQRCSHTYIPYTYIYSLLSHTRYLPPFFTTRFSRPINIIIVFIIWCSSLSSSSGADLCVFVTLSTDRKVWVCYCLSVRLYVYLCCFRNKIISIFKRRIWAFVQTQQQRTDGRKQRNNSHTNQWPRNLATAIATFVWIRMTCMHSTIHCRRQWHRRKRPPLRKAKEDSVQTYTQCTISVEKLTNFRRIVVACRSKAAPVCFGGGNWRAKRWVSSIGDVVLYLQKHCFTCAEKPIQRLLGLVFILVFPKILLRHFCMYICHYVGRYFTTDSSDNEMFTQWYHFVIRCRSVLSTIVLIQVFRKFFTTLGHTN